MYTRAGTAEAWQILLVMSITGPRQKLPRRRGSFELARWTASLPGNRTIPGVGQAFASGTGGWQVFYSICASAVSSRTRTPEIVIRFE